MLRFVYTFTIALQFVFSFASFGQIKTSNGNLPPLLPGFLTLHINTSSYFYQANEKVHFSVFVLNPGTLAPIQMHYGLNLTVLDSRGQKINSVAYYSNSGMVSNVLPAQLFASGGTFTLIAEVTYNGNKFTSRRNIVVQSVIRNNFLFTIDTDKEHYSPGDSMSIKLNVRQANGEAVKFTEIHLAEQFRSAVVNTYLIKSNQNGEAIIRLKINPAYHVNDLVFSAQVLYQHQRFAKTERINLNINDFKINAYIENGAYHSEIDNPIVLICSNKQSELSSHSFWIIHPALHDSTLLHSDAFGLCRYTLKKGISPADIRIRPANQAPLYLNLSLVYNNKISMGVSRKTTKNIRFSVYSAGNRELLLLSHMRGIKIEKRKIKVLAGWNFFDVDISNAQQGVLQTLLMDSNYHVLSEKLSYLHTHKSLHFKLDKYKLQANDYDKIQVSVTDHLGKPVKGIFSVSITDENNFVTLKDKQAKINENLLFENELYYPVKDIGKLFETKNDSLLDMFLTGCSMKNNFWKQILLDDNEQKALFCYQFKIYKNSGNYNHNVQSIEKLLFDSDKGKYAALLRDDGTVLVPTDEISFPAKCHIRFGKIKEVYMIEKHQAQIVLLRDSVFLTNKKPEENFIVLQNPVKTLIQIVDPVKPVEEATNLGGVSGRGSRLDGVTYYIDGVRVNSSSLTQSFSCGLSCYCSRSSYSCGYNSYTLNKSGLRSFNSIASLSAGVTKTQYGISGRGSRIDGTAYYIDGVKIMNPYPDFLTIEKMSRISNPNSLPTSGLPQTNDLEGGISGYGNYYSNGYYHASERRPQFVFSNIEPESHTYATNFDYVAQHEEEEELSCYYFYSHFKTNEEGKAQLEIMTPDRVMTWHINIQGSGNMSCGYFDSSISILQPVYMLIKTPAIMVKDDSANIEITITNEQNRPLQAELHDISHPENMIYIPEIAANSSYSYIEKRIFKTDGDIHYLLTYNHDKQQEIHRFVKIIENNYKKTESYQILSSGKHDVYIRNGNIQHTMIIKSYNPVYFSLESYLNTMIQEPHGCFEQVSSTNYPNILAFKLLQTKNKNNLSALERQKNILISGYRQLVKYETPTGGFSWYGTESGNEALTAMGLLQFKKLSDCQIPIDGDMLQRNKKWLLNRQNNSGKYIQTQGRYGFSNTAPEVAHAYITYVLSEIGEITLEKAINIIKHDLDQSPNLYNTALLCAILMKQGNENYSIYLQQLKTAFDAIKNKQVKSYTIKTIVNSSTAGAINETFALIASSIFSQKRTTEYAFAKQICDDLNSQDKFSWGNMQSKAFVLEAISHQDMIFSSPEQQPYLLKYSVNGISNEKTINPLLQESIDLSSYLKEGKNTVTFEFQSVNNIELSIEQINLLPFAIKSNSDFVLSAEFDKIIYKQSEVAFYHIKIKNTSKEILPQSVAIISIPTGMNIDPAELQFLTLQKICDFYEIKDNQIYLYWEEMNTGQTVDFKLPFICETSGRFTLTACNVYKYYQPENKTFFLPKPIVIH